MRSSPSAQWFRFGNLRSKQARCRCIEVELQSSTMPTYKLPRKNKGHLTMNERSFIVLGSMSLPQSDSGLDRRTQILDAAVVCFAKRGFHQASMHDISAEAGISVGLIYRYFQNKEAVISAMADRHKQEIQ